MNDTFDITPSPRVLRMLGQIEFKPWQCMAELIDNSIDSFLEGRRQAMILQPEISISLPSQAQLKAGAGKIRITDNGIGMPESIDMDNPETLGMRFLASLVSQVEGKMEVYRDNGTEIKIIFRPAGYNNRLKDVEPLI